MRLKIDVSKQTINSVKVSLECIQDFISHANKRRYYLDELHSLPIDMKVKTMDFTWDLEEQINFLKCKKRRKWLGYFWQLGILENISLADTNFSNMDLSGADLSNANLNRANFKGANLNGANLSSAKLDGANLSDAQMSKADLRNADLSNAVLGLTNLYGSNLMNANLYGAYLDGVDLREANLIGTNLDVATLNYVKGIFSFSSELHLFFIHKSSYYKSSASNIYVKVGCMGQMLEVWQDEEYREELGKTFGYSNEEVAGYYDVVLSFSKLLV